MTLRDAIEYFADYRRCHELIIRLRWRAGEVRCPVCGSGKVSYLEGDRVWKCYAPHPKPRFSLKTGTIFEDSAIPLEKWLPAVWMEANERDGISSWELHRALEVTQKTAWFMLQRIRLATGRTAGRRNVLRERVGAESSGSTAEQFEESAEFERLRRCLRTVLKVSKRELDRRVKKARDDSPRLAAAFPPGRKRRR